MLTNVPSAYLNGSMTLAVWAGGDQGWGSGNLAIQIDLSPDDGATWIKQGVYTADTIQQIEMYGVLLRADVVEIVEAIETPQATSWLPWWSRRRHAPPAPVVPAPVPVVLSAALYGPARSTNERWKITFQRGGEGETSTVNDEVVPDAAPQHYNASMTQQATRRGIFEIMTSKTKQTIRVGKTSLVHSSWSQTITFVNHEGVERRIEDATGHVMELVEAIKKGSGKLPQANQRHDYDTDGIPPENLQVRGGGEGRPQWPHKGGQFVGGLD